MKTPDEQDGFDNRTPAAGIVRGWNQSGLRAHNERLVLSLIRQLGPLAKTEIARVTGLSAQTVSVIMRALEADRLLEKKAPVRGKVGQPSVPMGLRADGAFFLGLKIGRRSLELILIDFLGKVLGRKHLACRQPLPDIVVDFTNSATTSLLETLTPEQRARVAGLGIATPFRLWDWPAPDGTQDPRMQSWRDRDLAADISQSWDFPVYLQNDASAACSAELIFGDQNKPSDFLYFYIGFFIGGGLVIDGSLFTGRTGNAAALGSIPIGKHGNKLIQLIDIASLVTLEQALIAAQSQDQIITENPDLWSVSNDVLDPWIKRTADGLAHAIATATCVIDVQYAIIDGVIPNDVRTRIVDETRKSLRNLPVAGIDQPDTCEGTIGSDARSLGAASLPLSDRFMVDRNAIQIAGS